jgi:hypothetical protein
MCEIWQYICISELFTLHSCALHIHFWQVGTNMQCKCIDTLRYAETFVVNAYLLKYFIVIFKNNNTCQKREFEMLKASHHMVRCIWQFFDWSMQTYPHLGCRCPLGNEILSVTSSNLPICICLVVGISVGLASHHELQNFLFLQELQLGGLILPLDCRGLRIESTWNRGVQELGVCMWDRNRRIGSITNPIQSAIQSNLMKNNCH